jgi:polyhydroxyalkanoate synthesis regulator phasin
VAKKDNAKKKSASGKSSGSSEKKQQSRGDAVRSAAAQAIEATAGQAGFTRERAQQLADELVHAAGRFRETLEDLRPPGADEIRALRERIASLEERIAKLEGAPKRAPARRRTTAAKPRAKAAAKPPAEPAATPPPEPPAAPPPEPEPEAPAASTASAEPPPSSS